MAATVSIEINVTTPEDKAAKITVSNINPEATNANLKALGQRITNLTQNYYESTVKITKEAVDTDV